jgi:predicted peptidase
MEQKSLISILRSAILSEKNPGPLGCGFLVFFALYASALANPIPGQYAQRIHVDLGEVKDLDYLLFIPSQYSESGEDLWPLIISLHGSEERGSDPELVKKEGIPGIVEKKRDFPFIVASPQCPNDLNWMPSMVKAIYDEVTKDLRVDRDRVYLTGFSMGGYGTWATAIQYPELFAAIAPIAGGGTAARAGKIKDIPVWAFHGALDQNVPVEESIDMVDAVNRSGGDASLSIYPDIAHDAWTATYGNPALYDWFLSHERPQGPTIAANAARNLIDEMIQFFKGTILIPLLSAPIPQN